MSNLLSLYFLHPITTRLANKTQRFNPRYELTNPTKTPSSPFAFSLLSTFLLHLHYTLQSPSTLFLIPFTLCYSPSFSCYPVSSSPVTIPLFLCYPVSSSPVTTPCSPVTLSPHPLLLPPVPLLLCLLLPCYYPLFLCYPVPSYPVSPPCRVKNVYLSHPQRPLLCPRQGLSSMQNMPFLPLEDALLVP